MFSNALFILESLAVENTGLHFFELIHDEGGPS
jgi:hypothetical protein